MLTFVRCMRFRWHLRRRLAEMRERAYATVDRTLTHRYAFADGILRGVSPVVTADIAASIIGMAEADHVAVIRMDFDNGHLTYDFGSGDRGQHEMVIPPMTIYVRMIEDILDASGATRRGQGKLNLLGGRAGKAITDVEVRYAGGDQGVVDLLLVPESARLTA